MAGRWTTWRAKCRLLAPILRPPPGLFFADALAFPELAAADAGGPPLAPYDGLAAVWDGYADRAAFDYPPFLAAVAAARGRPLRAVLDLACGTGGLTARLADAGIAVVGVDASEAMLARARRRAAGRPGVELVAADFRRLPPGPPADAAVCASNSLNYLDDAAELAAVFRGVAGRLAPGGVFLFDVFTSAGMRWLAGRYMHVVVDADRRFAVRFGYDPAARRETSVVLLPGGAETHRRVPVDPADVAAAAAEAGLTVDDAFALPGVPARWYAGRACFFVLGKPS